MSAFPHYMTTESEWQRNHRTGGATAIAYAVPMSIGAFRERLPAIVRQASDDNHEFHENAICIMGDEGDVEIGTIDADGSSVTVNLDMQVVFDGETSNGWWQKANSFVGPLHDLMRSIAIGAELKIVR